MTRAALLIALLAAFAPPAPAASPTDAAPDRVAIVLRAEATVPPGLVRLGDVAEIRTGDPARIAAWKAIELFPAPAEDMPRSVPRRAIQDMIALRLGASPAADFQGAATIRITTRTAAPADEPAATFTKPSARPLAKPISNLARRLAPPDAPAVQEDVEGLPIVVARRVVPSGQVITADDVEEKLAAGPREAGAKEVSLEEIVGKETTRPLAIGQPISPESVRLPLMVRRNEMVRIIARTAGIRVHTSGRALGDAPAGELVEVQLLGSREKILALATGSRTVEVYGRGPSVAAQESPTVRR